MLNTKAQKREKDYQYLADILKQHGVNSEEQVNAQLGKVMRKASYASVFVVLAALVVGLVARQYLPFAVLMGTVVFVWIWSSALSARRIMRRYIREEIDQPSASSGEVG